VREQVRERRWARKKLNKWSKNSSSTQGSNKPRLRGGHDQQFQRAHTHAVSAVVQIAISYTTYGCSTQLGSTGLVVPRASLLPHCYLFIREVVTEPFKCPAVETMLLPDSSINVVHRQFGIEGLCVLLELPCGQAAKTGALLADLTRGGLFSRFILKKIIVIKPSPQLLPVLLCTKSDGVCAMLDPGVLPLVTCLFFSFFAHRTAVR